MTVTYGNGSLSGSMHTKKALVNCLGIIGEIIDFLKWKRSELVSE